MLRPKIFGMKWAFPSPLTSDWLQKRKSTHFSVHFSSTLLFFSIFLGGTHTDFGLIFESLKISNTRLVFYYSSYSASLSLCISVTYKLHVSLLVVPSSCVEWHIFDSRTLDTTLFTRTRIHPSIQYIRTGLACVQRNALLFWTHKRSRKKWLLQYHLSYQPQQQKKKKK